MTTYSKDWDDATLGGDDNQNVALSTAQQQSGTHSINFNLSATTGRWLKTQMGGGGNPSVIVMQAYVYFGTLPSADSFWLSGYNSAAGGDGGLLFDQSAAKFVLAVDSSDLTLGTAGGPDITTGQWYKLDLRIDVSASTWVLDGAVDDQDLTQFTPSWTAGSFPDYRLGPVFTACTANAYMDSLVVSHTSGEYPIGGEGGGAAAAHNVLLLGAS